MAHLGYLVAVAPAVLPPAPRGLVRPWGLVLADSMGRCPGPWQCPHGAVALASDTGMHRAVGYKPFVGFVPEGHPGLTLMQWALMFMLAGPLQVEVWWVRGMWGHGSGEVHLPEGPGHMFLTFKFK